MILGVGVDLVDISRVERLLASHRTAFLKRLLSERETAESIGSAETAERAAARFALKEALAKSLGFGIFTLPLREIGLEFDKKGGADLIPSEKLAAVLSMRHVSRVFMDTACSGGYVMALVVLEGESS